MDRRYSSSSSSTATETAKKAPIGNALNSSIRFRNGLSSDSTVSANHRKSFPSTSDVGSSFNSTTQVIIIITIKAISHFIPFSLAFVLLSTFCHRLEFRVHLSICFSEINNIFEFLLCLIQNSQLLLMSRGQHTANTNRPTFLMLTFSFRLKNRPFEETSTASRGHS